MTTKKKTVVFPVTLTLTILMLFFCVLFLANSKTLEKEHSIEFHLPPENFYEKICGCSLEKLLSYRNFKPYQLTTNESQNRILFKQIQTDIKDMVRTNDSKNGINIQLNTKTKYGEVIKILNICKTEKVKTYVLKDYNVWIMTDSNLELEKNCPTKKTLDFASN